MSEPLEISHHQKLNILILLEENQMKTLTGYLNKNGCRVDEALTKGASDMAAVQKQMKAIVSYLNSHTLGLLERQLKETRTYLESANGKHVEQVVEDWMKKNGLWYADEVAPGSKEWWNLYHAVMEKVYKYDTSLWFEIIEPDETWRDDEEEKCLKVIKKMCGIK